MKHKFQIEGISCGGCVTGVKKLLEAHPGLDKMQIFLHPKGVPIIDMMEELSREDLQKQLDELGGSTIKKIK